MNVQFSHDIYRLLTNRERSALEQAVRDTVLLERRQGGTRTNILLRMRIVTAETLLCSFVADAGPDGVKPPTPAQVYGHVMPLYAVAWAVATDLFARGVRVEDCTLVQR